MNNMHKIKQISEIKCFVGKDQNSADVYQLGRN